MQTVVYIEQVIIDNFLLTIILLIVGSHIIKCKLNVWLIICSSIFSCLISLLYPMMFIQGILLFIFKLAIGYIIVFIATLNLSHSHQIKLYASFLLVTCLFAGIYFAIYYSLLINIGLQTIPIGCFAVLVFIMAKCTLKILKKYTQPIFASQTLECEIFVLNKKLKLNAFLDTGNMLVDQSSGLPVVIIEYGALSQILTKKEQLLLAQCSKQSSLQNLHYIDYYTVAGCKKILCFLPDKFIININNGGKKQISVCIGVSMYTLFTRQNYQAILGGAALQS